MYGDHKENIQEKIDYSYIGLISQKIKIGIIGGGKAAYIKASHFLNNNCRVEIVSLEFSDEIVKLGSEYKNNLKLLKESFNVDFLKDKHIIIICLNKKKIIKEVEEFCQSNYKIFINCADFKKGMGIIPAEVKGKNIIACVNSVSANPKGTVMTSKEIKKVIDEYDDFIGYSSMIRNKGKNIDQYKKTILEIAGSKEFKEYYDKGLAREYLEKYLDYDVVEYLINKG